MQLIGLDDCKGERIKMSAVCDLGNRFYDERNATENREKRDKVS